MSLAVLGRRLFVSSLLILIVTCGGAPPRSDSSPTTLTGTASMGAGVMGTVSLASLDGNDGTVLADLGSAPSDANGAYSIEAVTPDGLGRICVTGSYSDLLPRRLVDGFAIRFVDGHPA